MQDHSTNAVFKDNFISRAEDNNKWVFKNRDMDYYITMNHLDEAFDIFSKYYNDHGLGKVIDVKIDLDDDNKIRFFEVKLDTDDPLNIRYWYEVLNHDYVNI